jgi:hypothetical protein
MAGLMTGLKLGMHTNRDSLIATNADDVADEPCSMQSRITQTGSAWAWVSFIVALALTIPLIWRVWVIIGPNTYTGADGKGWQTLIRTDIEFAPAFHVNILNPLQGAAGFGNPINIWVDPVYWPFFSDDLLFATQGSTVSPRC